jgi:hypothetical protein
MLAFDRDVFFKDLPLRTGLAPKPAAKDGLNFLLDAFEADAGFTQIRDLAYVLATVRWETGQTFQPVKEKRASKDKNPRLWKLQNRYWSSGFFGRGYVQITWEKNYQKAGERLAGTAFTLVSGDLTLEVDTLSFPTSSKTGNRRITSMLGKSSTGWIRRRLSLPTRVRLSLS